MEWKEFGSEFGQAIRGIRYAAIGSENESEIMAQLDKLERLQFTASVALYTLAAENIFEQDIRNGVYRLTPEAEVLAKAGKHITDADHYREKVTAKRLQAAS